jgi:hypothetical protein
VARVNKTLTSGDAADDSRVMLAVLPFDNLNRGLTDD